MKRSEDAPADVSDREFRADGAGEAQQPADTASAETDGAGERAAAFRSEADYSMSRGDVIREIYDRKFYAPLQILLKDYRGIIGLTIMLGYLLMGTVGVSVIPAPTGGFERGLAPLQSMDHIMGTEMYGRDQLRMVVHATPPMLQMMLAGAITVVGLSTLIGSLAGFKRGMTDRVLMTITDIAMNLPGLPLLLVLVAVLQPSSPLVIGIILSINGWAGGARTLRAQILQIRNADHVEAARAMGVSTGRNIQKNVLPELMPLLMLRVMGSLRGIIYAAVGLYFLGVLPGGYKNWGIMLNRGLTTRGGMDYYTLEGAHTVYVPLLAISLFGLGSIFLAQAFDRVWNPRLRAKHAQSIVGSSDEEDEESATMSEVMY